MDADLQPVFQSVLQAEVPEDLFGAEDIVLPPEMLLEYLAGKYDGFKAVTNPENYANPADAEAADEADEKLERLYAEAKRRIRQYVYGIPGFGRERPARGYRSFRIGQSTFYVGDKISEGDRNSLYEGYLERDGLLVGEVVLKLANTAADTASIQNEIRILDVLHSASVPQWKHLPFMMEKFQAGERLGLVLRKISGHSLSQVRQHSRHKRGVDPRHMVWMLDRLLSVLGYVHNMGVVHGCMTPDRVLIQAETHNALLTGWSGAVHNPAQTGEKVDCISEVFSAPEVQVRGRIGPWSDVYSLGKIMIWITGGDPVTNEMPDTVPDELHSFLLDMVVESETKRPDKCWQLYEEQCAIKDGLWPRKFLHFDMA